MPVKPLTEKISPFFPGQLAEAGSVKAKQGGKSARSDWMTMEQDRGISIASTVLQFNYGNDHNLLELRGTETSLRTLTGCFQLLTLRSWFWTQQRY
ncbi:MAG: hypothetical protein CM15mP49_33160 [Actinomycetota bacterium]|nr:MAG: hypothetical protein CM15mP49_33160 [Actinomycetota bacterium]